MKYNYRKIIERDFDKAFYKPVNKAVETAAITSWRAAVNATPYITRRLQNGWKLNTGRGVGLIPAVGQYSFPTTPKFVFDIRKNDQVHMWNNIPYAYFVDAGVGPNRTPRNMLSIAYKQFDVTLKKEFRKL